PARIPKAKREYPRRRTEDIRPQHTSARTTALCRLFVPSFGHPNIKTSTSQESGPEDTAPH
ncbi:unnamed protein product, partial [Penicillium nalgiovense]